MTETTTGIRLDAVTKRFGSKEVLRGVTADLSAGRIHGLLGSNGVGKTTLMSLICGHAFRSAGGIFIDGEDPVENARILQRTCFVHEDQRYHDAFTAGQILAVVPHFYPHWSNEVAARLVERFRLPLTTRSKKLSRGQRSALAVTIALSSRAEYTFLDEPYLGLDAASRAIFYEELLTEYAAHPRTVVMSTHLIDEAADLMEEVIVLEEGRVALQADVDEARRSAFVVRGLAAQVRALAGSRDMLTERHLGGIVSATVRGQITAADRELARRTHLALEPASLQDFVAALGIHALERVDPAPRTAPGASTGGSPSAGPGHNVSARSGSEQIDDKELAS